MVQKLTQVNVADNSGAKVLNVIQILGEKKGRSFQKFGSVGDLISASVRKAIPNSNFSKGDVVHAVIIRTKKELKRKDGSSIRFDDNAVAIVSKETKEPRGTRVFGPVAREIKDRGYNKLISLAPEVL